MVDCMALLKPDAMTGHWEFTYGAERVKAITEKLGFPFLGQNIRDTEWNEAAFEPTATFERGGVKVAVIGQAFPYTPIANPRWLIPNWSFGIREEDLQRNVDKARADGAGLVVLLSHNGFDVDRKLATRVRGIDVILTSHTHDALPAPVAVGKTLLIASGSHGKFVTVLDLDVGAGRREGPRLPHHPGVRRCDRGGRRDGGQDRGGARAAREDAGRSGRPHRDAAVPPRQLQRHPRRRDLRCAAGRARRRDRAVARRALGRVAAARPGHHPRGHLSTPPPSPTRRPIAPP